MRENETTKVLPRRSFFCVDQDMKMKFEGNIEFSVTRGAWRGTSQLPVIVYAHIYSGVFVMCVMHVSLACTRCWILAQMDMFGQEICRNCGAHRYRYLFSEHLYHRCYAG